MPRKPATIKEIAAHLGISHTTVSRALNGHEHISESTKHLVRTAADTMGYVVNSSARLMRQRHNALVGLVIPDIRNDFYGAIAHNLVDRCRSAGLQMVLASTQDDPMIERDQVQALVEARAAGIVITPTVAPLERTALLLRSVTTVQLVRRCARLPGSAVCMDDRAAMRAATDHLLELGHRRIAYVGTRRDISAGRSRLDGFLDALRAARIDVDDEAVALVQPRQGFGAEGMELILKRARTQGLPTAVVIGNSELTIGALGAIRQAGLAIPGDLSVVGYGDPVWFSLLSPALTAVRLPIVDMAEAVSNLLLRQMAPDEDSAAQARTLCPVLVKRCSTAAPRRDPGKARPARAIK